MRVATHDADRTPRRRLAHACATCAIAIAPLILSCTKTSLTAPGDTLNKCQVSLSAPSPMTPADGGNGTISVGAAPECAWSVSTQAAWISDLAPASGQGAATIQFTIAANTSPAARQADITVNSATVRVNQAAAPCQFDVQPRAVSVPTDGGGASVAVSGAAGCGWTATSQESWLTINSGQSGDGNGTVAFTATPNPDPASQRSGALVVAGFTIPVTQSARTCAFSLTPASQSINDAGGSGSTTVTTDAGCSWTATSNAPWLTITGGASGSGPGTVTFTIARNTNINVQRSGTLTIGGQTFTVNQGPATCTFSAAPQSQNVGAAGGAATGIAVTTLAGCGWTSTTNTPWLRITAGASGNGPGSVAVSVDPNNGAARSGTLQVAGQAVTINQAATPCAFQVSPLSQQINVLGTNRTLLSLTTTSNCSWTASSTAGWIHITSGSGTGSGTINFSVDPNPTFSVRSGSITISGSAPTVTAAIGQDALVCSFGVSPSNVSLPSSLGSGTPVSITASPQSLCTWTASTATSWIHLSPPTSALGNGTLNWTYDANTGPQRTGSIAVSGQSVSVTQASGCTFSSPTPPLTGVPGDRVTSASFVVSTGAGCSWTVSANVPWILITNGTAVGNGPGGVQFEIGGNSSGVVRTGTFFLQGQAIYTVTQNP